MKPLILICTLILPTALVLAFSFPPNYKEEFHPLLHPWPLSLARAHRIATEAIGSATNNFHCIRTNGNVGWLNDGDWVFVFSSTNAHTKTVCVVRNYVRDANNTNGVVALIFDDLAHE